MNLLKGNSKSRDTKHLLTESNTKPPKDPLDMAEELGKIETDLHSIINESKGTPIETE